MTTVSCLYIMAFMGIILNMYIHVYTYLYISIPYTQLSIYIDHVSEMKSHENDSRSLWTALEVPRANPWSREADSRQMDHAHVKL